MKKTKELFEEYSKGSGEHDPVEFKKFIDKKTQYNDPDIEKVNELLKESQKIAKGFFTKAVIDQKVRKYKKISDKISDRQRLKQIDKQVKNHVNLVKKRNIADIQGWLRERKDKKRPGQTLMINMELRNGMHTHFLVVLSSGWFEFENGAYIIDGEYKYYDTASRIYFIDYHQDCCLPIKHVVEINDIKKAVMEDSDLRTSTQLNPETLQLWMKSDAMQKAIKAAEEDKWKKYIFIMLIVVIVIGFINMLLMVKGIFG